MLTHIRLFIKLKFPGLYQRLMALYRLTPRYKRQQLAIEKKLAHDRTLAKEIFPEFTVTHGPFAGMRYIDSADGSALLPKLLGSYEAQLHPWIEEFIARSPGVIVDVGCAEGYYAVGMAWRLPKAQVYAFDVAPSAREHCEALATLNDCAARVTVGSYCTHGELESLLAGGGLVICDIDGAEMQLLDPLTCPTLRKAHILVELHDHLAPGTTPTLLARFNTTHAIDLVADHPRNPENYGSFAHDARWSQLVREGRNPAMLWMRLRPLPLKQDQ